MSYTEDFLVYIGNDKTSSEDLIPYVKKNMRSEELLSFNLDEYKSEDTCIYNIFKDKSEELLNYLKGKDYESVTIVQNSHAGYYPGALPMPLKLLFSPEGEKLFGAEIVGREGVDQRIEGGVDLGGHGCARMLRTQARSHCGPRTAKAPRCRP